MLSHSLVSSITERNWRLSCKKDALLANHRVLMIGKEYSRPRNEEKEPTVQARVSKVGILMRALLTGQAYTKICIHRLDNHSRTV